MKKKTELLSAESEGDIITTISLLKQGELVALPTETVYGLAADANNTVAVQKIFIAKNRPIYHPLIVHIASFEKLSEWVKEIPPFTALLAEHFWPGPLTLLFNRKNSVSDIVTGGLETIAIRVPQNTIFLKILDALNTGLAAPSANPHKRISPTSARHVIAGLSGKIAAVLDGGPCKIGIESTIVDLTCSVPRILRPGPITQRMIEDILHISIDVPDVHVDKISGNMQVHYQPHTKALLMTLNKIKETILLPQNAGKLFGIMHYSHFECMQKLTRTIKMSDNKDDYGSNMYETLHILDSINAYQILIETPPCEISWCDILDRLSKASTQKMNVLTRFGT